MTTRAEALQRLLAIALRLAPDYLVFPVQGKRALPRGWPERASSDPAEVEALFRGYPTADGVGIATGGGLLAIDLDDGGEDSLIALEAQLGKLPPTRMVRTPRGGSHLYFNVPAGAKLRNTVGELGKGIDTRGDRGYVVAPGSPGYVWVDDAPTASLPAAWLDRIVSARMAEARQPMGPSSANLRATASPYAQRALDDEVTKVATSLEGVRNMNLNDASFALGQLVAGGELAADATRAALEAAGGEAGLDALAIRATVASGMTAGARHPRSAPPLTTISGDAIPAAHPGQRRTLRDALLIDAHLGAFPDPDPLVVDWLECDSLVVIYGPSGLGKTFFGMDIALSVAAGIDWHGNAVTQGPVIYVAAEGKRTLRPRRDAWMMKHRISGPLPIYWLTQAANLFDKDDAAELWSIADEIRPVLIVIDTLARSMTGGDESSTRDMAVVIDHADQVRRTCGSCLVLVHHTGWDTTRVRGASALHCAIDTEVEIKRATGGEILATIKKQRSGPDGLKLSLRLEVVGESCVPIADYDSEGKVLRPMTTAQRSVLKVLASAAGSLRYSDWCRQSSEIPDRSFPRHVAALVKRSLVRRCDDGTYALVQPLTTEREAA